MPKVHAERKVEFPEIDVKVYNKKPITVEQAKKWLGWVTFEEYVARETASMTEEQRNKAKIRFPDDACTLLDYNGNPVMLENNTHNRPFDRNWALTLAQDHLNRHWKINGETIIIGMYKDVLSGQHRLVGLVFAEQIRTSVEQESHWKEVWDGPVTMPGIVVLGVEETGETTRTLDNVKPRTLADVLFTDHDLFGKLKGSERNETCKVIERATKGLWKRTGAKDDIFTGRMTHSEALEFIRPNHPTLLKVIGHIRQENGKDDKLGQFLNLGTLSALFYLMASTDSDIDDYLTSYPRSEKAGKVNFDKWNKATKFLTEIMDKDSTLAKALRRVRRPVQDNRLTGDDHDTGYLFPTVGSGGGDAWERMCTLIRAWKAFLEGGRYMLTALTPQYTVREDKLDDGTKIYIAELDDDPIIGGIDLGEQRGKKKEEEPVDEEDEDDIDEEEVEERKEEARKKKEQEEGTQELDKKAVKKVKRLQQRTSPSLSLKDEIEGLKSEHNDKMLVFQVATGYKFYAEDAAAAAQLLKLTQKTVEGVGMVEVPNKQWESARPKLLEQGYKLAIFNGKQVIDGNVEMPAKKGAKK
jgi:hypothetical protein